MSYAGPFDVIIAELADWTFNFHSYSEFIE